MIQLERKRSELNVTGMMTIVVILMIVAFCILIWALKIMGRVAALTLDKEEGQIRAAALPIPAPALAVAGGPVIQDGIDEETVAAISAAIYSCIGGTDCDNGVSYVIKSIESAQSAPNIQSAKSVERATGGRPVWGFAGMQQNTRPF